MARAGTSFRTVHPIKTVLTCYVRVSMTHIKTPAPTISFAKKGPGNLDLHVGLWTILRELLCLGERKLEPCTDEIRVDAPLSNAKTERGRGSLDRIVGWHGAHTNGALAAFNRDAYTSFPPVCHRCRTAAVCNCSFYFVSRDFGRAAWHPCKGGCLTFLRPLLLGYMKLYSTYV